MPISDRFFINIKRIHIAHEFVIDRVNSCEYPYGRGCYGLVYVLDGSAEYRFTDGRKYSVGKGNIFFLAPDAAYSVNAEKEFRHYTVNFDIHDHSSELGILGEYPLILLDRNSELIRHGMKKISELWTFKGSGFEMQAVGELYTLLSHFHAEYLELLAPLKKSRLSPARKYIEENYTSPMSLDLLAGLCNMSVTNFRREWRKRYIESPLAYRDGIRLNLANELLASGYYTVGEIAAKCGFDDVSYFVRFYKKHTGITPGAVREQSL